MEEEIYSCRNNNRKREEKRGWVLPLDLNMLKIKVSGNALVTGCITGVLPFGTSYTHRDAHTGYITVRTWRLYLFGNFGSRFLIFQADLEWFEILSKRTFKFDSGRKNAQEPRVLGVSLRKQLSFCFFSPRFSLNLKFVKVCVTALRNDEKMLER